MLLSGLLLSTITQSTMNSERLTLHPCSAGKRLEEVFSQFHMCLLLRLLCASNQTLEYFIFFAILLVEFLMHLVIFVKRQKSRPSFKKVASYSCAQTFLSSHKTFSLQKENTRLWWLRLLVVVFLLTRTAQLFVSRRVPRSS